MFVTTNEMFLVNDLYTNIAAIINEKPNLIIN